MTELDDFLTWLHTRQRDAELAILSPPEPDKAPAAR